MITIEKEKSPIKIEKEKVEIKTVTQLIEKNNEHNKIDEKKISAMDQINDILKQSALNDAKKKDEKSNLPLPIPITDIMSESNKMNQLLKQTLGSDQPKKITQAEYDKKLTELNNTRLQLASKILTGIPTEIERNRVKEERKLMRSKIKMLEIQCANAMNKAVDYNALSRNQLMIDIRNWGPLVNRYVSDEELKVKSDRALYDLHVECAVLIGEYCTSSSGVATNLYIKLFGLIEYKGENFVKNKMGSSLEGLQKSMEEKKDQLKPIFAEILREHPGYLKYMSVWVQLAIITNEAVWNTIEKNKKKL